MKRYVAWKSTPDCAPIEGTDRFLSGISKRAILEHLAFEEGVEYQHNDMIVMCKDDTFWSVSQIS